MSKKLLCVVKRNQILRSRGEKQDLSSENLIQFTHSSVSSDGSAACSVAQHTIMESKGKNREMCQLCSMSQTQKQMWPFSNVFIK